MRQWEKYEILAHALWHYTKDVIGTSVIKMQEHDICYLNGDFRTGSDLKEIYNKLIQFRDEARIREKII